MRDLWRLMVSFDRGIVLRSNKADQLDLFVIRSCGNWYCCAVPADQTSLSADDCVFISGTFGTIGNITDKHQVTIHLCGNKQFDDNIFQMWKARKKTQSLSHDFCWKYVCEKEKWIGSFYCLLLSWSWKTTLRIFRTRNSFLAWNPVWCELKQGYCEVSFFIPIKVELHSRWT